MMVLAQSFDQASRIYIYIYIYIERERERERERDTHTHYLSQQSDHRLECFKIKEEKYHPDLS